jgi:hypothetical protein
MMVKKRPWAGVEPVQIITSVVGNTRLRIPKDCDPIFAQIMKMCWRQNPAQRYNYYSLSPQCLYMFISSISYDVEKCSNIVDICAQTVV